MTTPAYSFVFLIAPFFWPVQDAKEVHWKGTRSSAERIATECGEAPARAITAWSSWASAHRYDLHLSADGRVLLLIGAKKDARAERDLVERTCRFVDELLASSDPQRPATGTTEPLEPAENADSMLGVPDSDTAVLVQARDTEDYAAFLEHAAKLEPYLASWVETGNKLAGCTLVRPLSSAWIELLDGQEEWDIKNELVHRLAHLLVVRRFGELPFWLIMGLSWYVEDEIRGGIYCFPYRDEFVWATEHGSWKTDLARILEQNGTRFLDDLVRWRRGSYESTAAREAWGFASFLATKRRDAIVPILADFRLLRAEKGVERDGHRWEIIVGWEPSRDDQHAILARHLGESYPDEVVRAYGGK